MVYVHCQRLKDGVKFTKTFISPYQARVFINRCVHGNTIRILATASTNPSWMNVR